MSINGILNDDNFFIYVALLTFIITAIAIPLGIFLRKKTNKNIWR